MSSSSSSSVERSEPGSAPRVFKKFEAQRLPTQLFKKRVHFSNFMVTMNTNQQPDSIEDAERIARELEHMGDAIFGSEDAVKRFVVFRESPDVETMWRDSVFKCRSRYVVEIGDKEKRMHLHVSLKLVHNTFVRLNLDRIYQAAQEHLEGSGVTIKYLNISVGRPSPEDYIEKYQF